MKDIIVRDNVKDIVLNLKKGKGVKVTGLGKFKIVKVKPRMSYDVVQGKVVKRGSHNRIMFNATKSLKDFLR